jgi:hypothetical protein
MSQNAKRALHNITAGAGEFEKAERRARWTQRFNLITAQPVIFQIACFATLACKSNIEMTPLCNIEVTLPRVLGSREVRRGGGVVDEQAGVRPS